jgi:hypothetical protein
MKFGKYWKTEIEKLPTKLQKYALHYKKWKKINVNNANIIIDLAKECNIVNNIITKNTTQKSSFFSFCKKETKLDQKQLYDFAMLNKKTLYKICKKLDKKFNCEYYKPWLQKYYNKFLFNCGIYHTKMSLVNNKEVSQSCPICITELNDNVPSVITECGHVFCYPCILVMYNIRNKRGTIHNLINNENVYHRNKDCPICRSSIFMDGLDKNNIYPAKFEYILDTIDH